LSKNKTLNKEQKSKGYSRKKKGRNLSQSTNIFGYHKF